MNKEKKASIIANIKQYAGSSSVIVITDFKEMPVEELNALRVELRRAGGRFLVVKNTLARLALSEGDHNSLSSHFKENCGLVFGFEDPVAAVKAVVDFTKNSKFLKIRIASLNGQLLSEEKVVALSKLPSREALLSSALGTLNQIPTGFVSLFANMIRSLLYGLKAIEEQKSK
ncbi:MAG: 50S ribosomal protein L10 [Desulfovibrionaceae bacterium]|nr:50S ribosomal protein L10 [Desulfovibrionaceae bacterium]